MPKIGWNSLYQASINTLSSQLKIETPLLMVVPQLVAGKDSNLEKTEIVLKKSYSKNGMPLKRFAEERVCNLTSKCRSN